MPRLAETEEVGHGRQRFPPFDAMLLALIEDCIRFDASAMQDGRGLLGRRQFPFKKMIFSNPCDFHRVVSLRGRFFIASLTGDLTFGRK
jgi:hypothetical protein